VAFAPDGGQLVSGGGDGTVRLWNARAGTAGHVLMGHTEPVLSVAFHPRHPQQLVSCGDGTIRLWNARTGRQFAGSGFGVRLQRMRPLAGIRTDIASVEDLLGIGDDVETLAVLAAAAATEPPLAIALLGEWGAGKSSLMAQMHDQVARLAEDDFRGCMFINSFGELGATAPRVAEIVRAHKAKFQARLAEIVAEAGAPAWLAPQLAILAEGAQTTAAIAGTNDAARQARQAAEVLIDAAIRRCVEGLLRISTRAHT
jgi:hypothetical protein